MTQARRFELLELRAVDAVADCLVRLLTVPRVYINAHWPDASREVDLLAIDRAGEGDVHVVEIKAGAAAAIDRLPQLMAIPASFRWLAVLADTITPELDAELRRATMPERGAGRVGVIGLERVGPEGLRATVLLKAERFPGSLRREVAAFTAAHAADIQFEGIDDLDPSAPPPPPVKLTAEQVEQRLAEIEELRNGGHPEAAFLLAWSVAEAMMRHLAEREAGPVSQETPTALVRLLRACDIINPDEEDLVRRIFPARNQLVHGYGLSGSPAIPLGEVVRLIETLRRRVA